MAASPHLPALQACTLALGLALIHAGRAYAAAMTKVLAGIAVIIAALVLLTATVKFSHDDIDGFDDGSLAIMTSG